MIRVCSNCDCEFEWESSPSDDYCVGCYTVGGLFGEEVDQL